MSGAERVIYLGPGAQQAADRIDALLVDLGRTTWRQHRRDLGQDARLTDLERLVVALTDRLVKAENLIADLDDRVYRLERS